MHIDDFITVNVTSVAINSASAQGIAAQNTAPFAWTYEHCPWDHPNANVLHTFQKDHKRTVDGQLLEKHFFSFLYLDCDVFWFFFEFMFSSYNWCGAV